MSLSRKERQKLHQEERLGLASESVSRSTEGSFAPKKSNALKYSLWGVGLIVLLIIGAAGLRAVTPGPYDDFAKCLSEKGAVMYGAMGWCEFTQGQKAMFGKSFRHLNYQEFTEFPKEQYGEIKKTPTWIINGKVYPNAQSFQALSTATGCPLP